MKILKNTAFDFPVVFLSVEVRTSAIWQLTGRLPLPFMRAIKVQLRTTFSTGLLPPLRQTARACCTTNIFTNIAIKCKYSNLQYADFQWTFLIRKIRFYKIGVIFELCNSHEVLRDDGCNSLKICEKYFFISKKDVFL